MKFKANRFVRRQKKLWGFVSCGSRPHLVVPTAGCKCGRCIFYDAWSKFYEENFDLVPYIDS